MCVFFQSIKKNLFTKRGNSVPSLPLQISTGETETQLVSRILTQMLQMLKVTNGNFISTYSNVQCLTLIGSKSKSIEEKNGLKQCMCFELSLIRFVFSLCGVGHQWSISSYTSTPTYVVFLDCLYSLCFFLMCFNICKLR